MASGYSKVGPHKPVITTEKLEFRSNDEKNSLLESNPSSHEEVPLGNKKAQNTLEKQQSKNKKVTGRHQPSKQKPIVDILTKRWICNIQDGGCGGRFSTKGSLKTHTENHCPARKEIQPGSSRSKLRKARSSHPNNKDPVKCQTDQATDQLLLADSHEKIFEKYCGIGIRPRGFKTADIFWCLICKNPEITYFSLDVHSHLANKHPETFFSGKKLPEFSEEGFKSCCKQNLYLEANETFKLSENTKLQGLGICLYCGENKYKVKSMRFHLILRHHEILEKKLALLQEKFRSTNLNLKRAAL